MTDSLALAAQSGFDRAAAIIGSVVLVMFLWIWAAMRAASDADEHSERHTTRKL